jgi:hypothetical protein
MLSLGCIIQSESQHMFLRRKKEAVPPVAVPPEVLQFREAFPETKISFFPEGGGVIFSTPTGGWFEELPRQS